MKGGYRIATIRGIPIRIHISFLIILPFLAWAFAGVFRSAAELAGVPPEQIAGSRWLWGLVVALALFASVLVHELAHSLYALKKGGQVRGITLLMIGGVSQIGEAPRAPRHEAVMALVGPLVSLALAVAFYLLHLAVGSASFELSFALFYLAVLNGFLGVFNLLPAFPMDGGRILRAVLASRMGPVRSTHVAAAVGKGFAVLFGIFGFLSLNVLLMLIAVFVYVGADAEARGVVARALLGRLRVREVMRPDLAAVPADLPVAEVAAQMLRERRIAYVVVDQGAPVGVVTFEKVREVSPEARAGLPVRAITTAGPTLSPDDDASKALRLMSESDVPEVIVADAGGPLGTVTRDDIIRILALSELERDDLRRRRVRLAEQV